MLFCLPWRKAIPAQCFNNLSIDKAMYYRAKLCIEELIGIQHIRNLLDIKNISCGLDNYLKKI